MLTISPDKVCYVIAKARELDVKVAAEELDDEGMGRILEDYADDPTLEELKSFLEAQSDDELRELLALAWVGRGDFGADEWQEALAQVQDVREKHRSTICSARRCCATIWRRVSPSSATPARSERAVGLEPGLRRATGCSIVRAAGCQGAANGRPHSSRSRPASRKSAGRADRAPSARSADCRPRPS